ncbi:agmatine deiminase family protein [Glaciibacter psychrotolerans]
MGADAASAEEARHAWSAVAHAIAEFEPVTMLVDPSAGADARRHLSSEVTLVDASYSEFWLRDSGPTFVIGDDGRLGAIDWIFNGWGATDWSEWKQDQSLAAFVATLAGAEIVPSLLVNEGGAIHVDGDGTVLVTETVQLDPHRNPFADKRRIEAELTRTLGATRVIWLPRGLTRDYEELGTRGHVDMVATISSPGTILVHEQQNPEHPDYQVSRQIRACLEDTVDAEGREWQIIALPAPENLRDERGFVDWSYVNHLVVNDGVIACGYGEERADAHARDILSAAYPGRRVVTVDARPILARGGGIHCITQQQPVAKTPPLTP